MKKVYIYKTKDGTSFDFQADALRHERKGVLQNIFSSVVMPEDERTRLIDTVLNKFDAISEAFEEADVLNPDLDDD
jgi:hypothetical protein